MRIEIVLGCLFVCALYVDAEMQWITDSEWVNSAPLPDYTRALLTTLVGTDGENPYAHMIANWILYAILVAYVLLEWCPNARKLFSLLVVATCVRMLAFAFTLSPAPGAHVCHVSSSGWSIFTFIEKECATRALSKYTCTLTILYLCSKRARVLLSILVALYTPLIVWMRVVYSSDVLVGASCGVLLHSAYKNRQYFLRVFSNPTTRSSELADV
jgi:hypothetical protein